MLANHPYLLLKLNRLLKNHSVKCMGVLVADKLGMRHLSVRIDPFVGCNLRCRMCHFSSPEFYGRKSEILAMDDYSRIARLLFRKAVQVVLGTGAEPTLHPHLPKLVEIAKQEYGVPFVSISSNAQLLTMDLATKLIAAGLDEYTISTHGVHQDTYERLQPPATFEKLHRAFANLTELAKAGSHKFSVRVNFTVNPDNHAELGEFFDVFGGYKIDTLQIRKVFDVDGAAYADRDLSRFETSLEATRLKLLEECRKRGTTLLCPSFQTKPEAPNPQAAILLPLVYRYASPSMVWREDFDWRHESYEVFCKRIHWHRRLVSMAFTRAAILARDIQDANRSLGYEVGS